MRAPAAAISRRCARPGVQRGWSSVQSCRGRARCGSMARPPTRRARSWIRAGRTRGGAPREPKARRRSSAITAQAAAPLSSRIDASRARHACGRWSEPRSRSDTARTRHRRERPGVGDVDAHAHAGVRGELARQAPSASGSVRFSSGEPRRLPIDRRASSRPWRGAERLVERRAPDRAARPASPASMWSATPVNSCASVSWTSRGDARALVRPRMLDRLLAEARALDRHADWSAMVVSRSAPAASVGASRASRGS